MKRFIYTWVFSVLCAMSVSAQTVTRTIDPTTLPWGPFVDVRPVDADGDPRTEEWLVFRRQTAEFHVVSVDASDVCIGSAFTIAAVPAYGEMPDVVRWQSQDVLKVKRPTTLFSYVFDFITLTRPVCERAK